MRILFSVFCLLLLITSCNQTKRLNLLPTQPNINSLNYLGQYIVPHNYSFKNTTVGGLSSIDYDAAHQLFYIISDDRSEVNAARFYTAKINVSANGIDSFYFVDVKNMLQPDKTVYPNSKKDARHTPDPEAMRYNPITLQLVWSSEGERIVKAKDTVLENPEINVIKINGKYKYSYPIPSNTIMHATEYGPRQNGVFEGMSFADNYKTLFVNIEEPLYQDGPRADITDNNAFIRILKFDVATKKNIAQYAYKLDPIAFAANPSTAFKINSVPDILNIGKNKFLITERSFSTGRLACTIKVFIADFTNATNIIDVPSLKENTHFVAASKKLLLDMNTLGIYTDNIEGATFGPVLPNGHKTLIFIADNNFSAFQKTQLLLFEVQ